MSRLRLVRRPAAPPPAPKPGTWGPLAEPVLPDETDARIRAQSLLSGTTFRDGSSACPPLTLDQARDVLAWNRSTPPTGQARPSSLGRWWAGLFRSRES